ncbi:putative membrane protein [Citrobacter rodentium ICC168]|uniref:Membrane protein n=1 Tax=Citrobacter rodentium (strain ICC168) TaxID=637910 RepID=D2TP07_CITRI|nr:putative membrane protein [Citrobacter rodentium ICC168]
MFLTDCGKLSFSIVMLHIIRYACIIYMDKDKILQRMQIPYCFSMYFKEGYKYVYG